MADLTLTKKNELEDYKCSANDVIRFKLVRKSEDLDDEAQAFPPDMTHQIFGESETIFGYKDLSIALNYTSATLLPCLSLSHNGKCSVDEHGVKPDPVESLLKDELPEKYLTNLDVWRAQLEKDASFRPFGKKIDQYCVTTKGGIERQFEVYEATMSDPGFSAFHDNLQSFIKYFIDAASYIDPDDPQWSFFVLYEKYSDSGCVRFATAGYMTVYRFYAYPSHVRPRISQVLVLPPFQRLGLCARMIQTFYNTCLGDSEVRDITVEDPSDNFQRVRLFVDARNCLKLKEFSPDLLLQGFTTDMSDAAQEKLKLSKVQTRRIYEILRLRATNRQDKQQFRAFRLDVKKRLNLPFMRSRRLFQKLEKDLSPEELRETLGVVKPETRMQVLEKCFQDDLAFYDQVLARMEHL